MHLQKGRLEGMIQDAVADDSSIVCHQTLQGDNAVCSGFFEKHRPQTLQIAHRMGMIKEVSLG